MFLKDTPPSSPDITSSMDEEEVEFYEEDVEERVDSGEELPDDGEENDEPDEMSEPTQDDAAVVFEAHTSPVFCCDLSPAGNLAVTGGQDDMAYVWNLQTGQTEIKCEGHKDSVSHAFFNHDGTYVATADMSGVIQVWKTSNKTLIWSYTMGDLSWLKWHHGANVLLAGAVTGEVYVWRIPSGDCKILQGHGEKNSCGLVMPDGKRAVICYEDAVLKVFDMRTETVLQRVEVGGRISSESIPISATAHTDNNLVLVGATNGTATLVNTQSGKILSVLDCRNSSSARTSERSVRGSDDAEEPESTNSSSSVEAVGLCSNMSMPWAATGTLDGRLIIWDVSKQVRRLECQLDGGVTCLQWNENATCDSMIWVGCVGGEIYHIDARDGKTETRLYGHTDSILSLCLSKDGSTLLTSANDCKARVFRLTEGTPPAETTT
ncbi:angio-associated migratory cell protein [Ischnura elegans]|uniref:angio-associated migratory cell protein n=1 Tax=Ischnura elegans TaxID=197161 RepID=UPI001ED8A5BD|nr:angio-associated migratory cell protein [Ischnura elegans]